MITSLMNFSSSNKLMKLAACCLNISEGRNQQLIESIANAAVAGQSTWTKANNIQHREDTQIYDGNNHTHIPGIKATVLSVYSDPIFNRSNVTIVAPLDYLAHSVVQACQTAFESVDLTKHVDFNHPRLGAVDLVPIHPLTKDVPLVSCASIACEIARNLTDSVPGSSVFLFGAADALGRGLVERRKQMKWFSETNADGSFQRDRNVKPDLGTFTKQYGVTAVGAIPYMTVLNMILDTDKLDIGQKIARSVRASNKMCGLPGVQAMAFKKKDVVEVACNIDTPNLQVGIILVLTDEVLSNAPVGPSIGPSVFRYLRDLSFYFPQILH